MTPWNEESATGLRHNIIMFRYAGVLGLILLAFSFGNDFMPSWLFAISALWAALMLCSTLLALRYQKPLWTGLPFALGMPLIVLSPVNELPLPHFFQMLGWMLLFVSLPLWLAQDQVKSFARQESWVSTKQSN